MARKTEDEQVPDNGLIAPQEPSEAYPGPGEWPPEITSQSDPFIGYMADNATVVESWWAGLPNYQCSLCQYAHLDRERTAAHVFIHGQTFTQGARP